MLLLLVITIAIIIAYLVYMRIKHMSCLARNGIPGPKPSLIYGNIFEYRESPSIVTHVKWIETYGKVVGYYDGNKPTVLVADPDLAKNIQIKDFQYFTNRPKLALKNGMNANPWMMAMVARRDGMRWKQMRYLLQSTFSASKLKTMTPIIEESINEFIDIVDKHCINGQEFDIYEMFQHMTTDVITRTAFGIDSNVQKVSNNEFFKASKGVNTARHKWIVLAIQCFPVLDTILYPFRRLEEIIRQLLGMSSEGILYGMAKEMIRLRKQDQKERRKDLLQLMIDTKISEEEMSGMTDEKRNVKRISGISLTEEEIVANCALFYEGGIKATSAALAFVAHILVNYADIQERVRQEVRGLYERDGKLDINVMNGLELMEMVLNEALRVYPPDITFTTRECTTDYEYRGMTIPKGATVMICTHYMHNDPDYWPEPDVFDPNRFSGERRHNSHPSSWQPFGSGPRNCIALRFALFEIKLTLAKLLMRYRLVASPNTEIGELSTECKLIFLVPKYGVFVKAIKL